MAFTKVLKTKTSSGKPDMAIDEIRKRLRASGWEVGGNNHPHMELSCRHPEHGSVFIGKLDGDLLYVPMDGIASVAGEFRHPVVMLTQVQPPRAVNEAMMERNCFLLHQDGLPLLTSVLMMLRLENKRQQAVMSTARLKTTSSENVGESIAYSSADLTQQVFRALLRRDASETDVAHYAGIFKDFSATAVQRLVETISSSKECRSRLADDATRVTAKAELDR